MPGIIDGRSWLEERKLFLEGELTKDPAPAPEQRHAIEAELAKVTGELAAKRRHWWRFLVWGGRPPQ